MRCVRFQTYFYCVLLAGLLLEASWAQTATPPARPREGPNAKAPTDAAITKDDPRQAAKRKFVLDVVQSAVALPEPDPQDRLRVLHAAAGVVAPINGKMALQFAKEGTRIEAELVNAGQKPAVSMLSSGHIDCPSALSFVQTIPASAVADAEQSLLGAITTCPKDVTEPAKRKLEAALESGVVAARPILALMELEGMKTPWSRTMFQKLFASLPSNAMASLKEAPNYAAMFVRAAPEMDKDETKSSGKSFLLWLGKLPDSPERNVAVNMTIGVLSDTLGADGYAELLRSDVMVQQVANTAGQPAGLTPEGEESVSVLRAMEEKDDRTSQLQAMSPSLRAREAAASGFASGSSGDRKQADHYFDIAFSSLNEVWEKRNSLHTSAPDIVEEVSEAAAQVDPVEALQRSQGLQDPSAEAISMLAVARVVVGSP